MSHQLEAPSVPSPYSTPLGEQFEGAMPHELKAPSVPSPYFTPFWWGNASTKSKHRMSPPHTSPHLGQFEGAMPPPTRGAELRALKAPCAEWVGVWGRVFSPQPTRGSGERHKPPAGSGNGGNAFWRFWRRQNATVCTYMPILWVRQTVFHVTFGGKAEAIAPVFNV